MLEVVVAVVLLVVGAVLLTAGAEAFAEHITAAAVRLRVSVLALGVLVAGAEPEEAVTAMVASGRGHPALAAGDAVGANLVILTVAVGLAALLTPLPVSRRVGEYAGAAAGACLLATVLMWNGVLGRGEATVLVLGYVVGAAWVWRREQAPPAVGELAEAPVAGERGEESSRALLWVLLGVLGMVTGGFLAVQGATGMVGTFGMTESVVGLTVLALATSAEMVALVFAAHRRGVAEIAVAGAAGSVAYNATVSLGLAAWVDPLVLGRGSPIFGVALVTVALSLVLLAGRRTGVLPRPLGALLVAGYLGTAAWLFAR